MSEEIKFLYMWMFCRGDYSFLVRWLTENTSIDRVTEIAIPGNLVKYYFCRSDDLRELIGM